MQIYELRRDADHYRWLDTTDGGDITGFEIDSSLVGATWEPLVVQWMTEDMEGTLEGDFPTLGNLRVFSQKAVDALLELLVENGELLPLISKDGQFYVYNVTRVADALDEERSEVVRFKTSGRIMRIEHYRFRSELLAGLSIFKVPQLTEVFVTDAFVKRVQEANLKGFAFRELWSSEPQRDG